MHIPQSTVDLMLLPSTNIGMHLVRTEAVLASFRHTEITSSVELRSTHNYY